MKQKLVYWWFSTVDLSKFGNDSVIPQVNNKDINPLIIPVPPFPKQKSIAAKVKKSLFFCDQLESQTTKSQKNLEFLMQAVLKEAFEG
ncbi:MAG: restriction endonuclease subunit S [Gammaproteobacteria bacterium]|nr:restriction endonuclease subunit S [Gammaproteobacteria bacterium]